MKVKNDVQVRKKGPTNHKMSTLIRPCLYMNVIHLSAWIGYMGVRKLFSRGGHKHTIAKKVEKQTTVKLGHNKQLGTGQIRSL